LLFSTTVPTAEMSRAHEQGRIGRVDFLQGEPGALAGSAASRAFAPASV